jgi:hypothetical protein
LAGDVREQASDDCEDEGDGGVIGRQANEERRGDEDEV